MHLKLQIKLLHKTVRGYIVEDEDVSARLHRWAPNNFKPYVVLCRGLLLHMKRLPRFSEGQRESGFQSYRSILGELFRYLREAEQLDGYVDVSLIDEVNGIVPEIMACNGPPKGPPTTLNLLRSVNADDFLAFAIGQRPTLYFKAKIAGRGFERPTDHEWPLLDHALRSFRQFPEHWNHAWMGMAEFQETHHLDADMVKAFKQAQTRMSGSIVILPIQSGADPWSKSCKWARYTSAMNHNRLVFGRLSSC